MGDEARGDHGWTGLRLEPDEQVGIRGMILLGTLPRDPRLLDDSCGTLGDLFWCQPGAARRP
jgi:hypothetical protein